MGYALLFQLVHSGRRRVRAPRLQRNAVSRSTFVAYRAGRHPRRVGVLAGTGILGDVAQRPSSLPYTKDTDASPWTGAMDVVGRQPADVAYKLTRTVVGMLLGAAVSGVAAWTLLPSEDRSNIRSYNPARRRRP